jgi:hypothetical protein
MYESNGTQIYLPLLKQFGLELNYLRLVDGQSSRKFHPLAIVGRFLATPLLYDSRAFQSNSLEVQSENLKTCMSSKSSFPVLAYWGSTPVAFLEIFWVLEDRHGRLRGKVEDWDRGFRFFIGDVDFNGLDNLALFLSSVVHYCWLCDQRTSSVLVEVSADNERYGPLQTNGCSCQFLIFQALNAVKPILTK